MIDQLHQEFASILEAWAAAIVANDPDAIGSFMEPDWSISSLDSGMTRDSFLSLVASGELTHSAMRFNVLSAQAFGDLVVVVAPPGWRRSRPARARFGGCGSTAVATVG